MAVVKKFSFKEAEDADDKYWSEATEEERLKELVELRKMVFGDNTEIRIRKTVSQRSIYDEEE